MPEAKASSPLAPPLPADEARETEESNRSRSTPPVDESTVVVVVAPMLLLMAAALPEFRPDLRTASTPPSTTHAGLARTMTARRRPTGATYCRSNVDMGEYWDDCEGAPPAADDPPVAVETIAEDDEVVANAGGAAPPAEPAE